MSSSDPALHTSAKISFWKILSDAFATYKIIFLPLTLFLLLYGMVQTVGVILTVMPWTNDVIRGAIKIASVLVSLYFYIVAMRMAVQTVNNTSAEVKEMLVYARKKFISYLGLFLYTLWYIVRWAIVPLVGAIAAYSYLLPEPPFKVPLSDTVVWFLKTIIASPLYVFLLIVIIASIIHMIIRSVRTTFAPYAFVQDDTGIIKSVETSVELTKNRWWLTFGCIFLIQFIVNSVAAGVINRILEVFLGSQGSAIDIARMVIGALAGGLIMIFSVYLYKAMKK